MNKDKETKEFLGAKEVQDWIGISKPTLLSWLNRTDDPLPGVKVGGRWRFRRQSVLQWWERQEGTRPQKSKANKTAKEPAKKTSQPVPPQKRESNREIESWLRMASRVLGEKSDSPKDTNR